MSFFKTTSIRPCNLSNLVPLRYPHGAPLPPTYMVTSLYVFSIQQAQKRCLMSKSSRKFEIFKLEGGKLILLILRLYMSTLMSFCSLWATPTRLLRLFPCCTNTIPCPNFRHRCSDQTWVFLYTSKPHGFYNKAVLEKPAYYINEVFPRTTLMVIYLATESERRPRD